MDLPLTNTKLKIVYSGHVLISTWVGWITTTCKLHCNHSAFCLASCSTLKHIQLLFHNFMQTHLHDKFMYLRQVWIQNRTCLGIQIEKKKTLCRFSTQTFDFLYNTQTPECISATHYLRPKRGPPKVILPYHIPFTLTLLFQLPLHNSMIWLALTVGGNTYSI